MDGIDVALIRSDGHFFVERGPNIFLAYEKDTRQRIREGLETASRLKDRTISPDILADLECELTELHGRAVGEFLDNNNINTGEIDLIGFHGQTVLHRPQYALTIQLGDGQKLADQTGIEVIYDFRANDMLNNGQGAPLVPVYHGALANNIPAELIDGKAMVFVNIGGISNITHVDSDGCLTAFDSGPGNGLIDQWVLFKAGLDYDDGGKIAAGGKVIEEICRRYLSHPYFELPIPKSLDRKDFEPLLDDDVSLADGARSLARLTASTIVHSIDQLPSMPAVIVVCGGGALNKVIMSDLQSMAIQIGTKVITAEQAGLSAGAMEAEAFAYLAIRAKLGEPLTYPKTTGCSKPVTGGVSALPDIATKTPKKQYGSKLIQKSKPI